MSKVEEQRIDPTEIRERLSHELHSRLDRAGKLPGVTRVQVEIPLIDPLLWLDRVEIGPKWYWRSRNESKQIAGIGSCIELRFDESCDFTQVTAKVHELLALSDSDVLCLGGFSFDFGRSSKKQTEERGRFPSAWFAVPEVQIEVNEETAHLILNATGEQPSIAVRKIIDQAIRAVCDCHPREPQTELSGPHKRLDTPSESAWKSEVDQALRGIESGQFEKIVLARKTGLEFENVLSPWALLVRLRGQGEDKFLFGFQPARGPAFVGASPELLYRRDGQQIRSEAIAGTRKRGLTATDDVKLSEELTASAKDRLEHRIVVDHVRCTLGPLCTELSTTGDDQNLKLRYLQHIITRFAGTLNGGVTDGDLLAALHPTPAVGGAPREESSTALSTIEPFERGWYAGPIGWIGKDTAEFAVAIRSALVRERELVLYSGAGIVAGSEADHEWRELDNKIQPFLRVLKD